MTRTLVAEMAWALRLARRRPGAAVSVALTLALAIGATTMAYAVAAAILWTPLPFRDAPRLAFLWEERADDGDADLMRVTSGRYAEWRDRSRSFTSIAAFGAAGFTIDDPAGAVPVRGVRVTSAYFDTIGIAPFLGRGFAPADETPGQHFVVILSHALWRDRFGGRADAIGESLRLSGQPYTVVGVMPPVVFPAWPVNPASVTLDDAARQLWTPIPLVYRGLVMAQVAATMALTVAAGLLTESLWSVRDRDPGFVIDGVTVANVTMPGAPTAREAVIFEQRILDGLAAVAGVSSAATAYDHPLEANWTDAYTLVGSDRADEGSARLRIVSPAGVSTSVAAAIRSTVRDADRGASVATPRTLQSILDEQLVSRRVTSDLIGGLSLAALALSALGVYGLFAVVVAGRTREIGVRIALGAPPARVGRQVVRESLVNGGVGVAGGVVLAVAAGRFLESLLVGVSAYDPTTLGGVATVILCTALAAAVVPARRAARVDPAVALRNE